MTTDTDKKPEKPAPTLESLNAELAVAKEEYTELRAHYTASQAQVAFLDATISAMQVSIERLQKRLKVPSGPITDKA